MQERLLAKALAGNLATMMKQRIGGVLLMLGLIVGCSQGKEDNLRFTDQKLTVEGAAVMCHRGELVYAPEAEDVADQFVLRDCSDQKLYAALCVGDLGALTAPCDCYTNDDPDTGPASLALRSEYLGEKTGVSFTTANGIEDYALGIRSMLNGCGWTARQY